MNEIDKLYTPSYWAKRLPPHEIVSQHLEFIGKESENVRSEIHCELNVSYGNSSRQKIDIFGCDLVDDAPIFIFIHGGYWHIKDINRTSYEFIAKNLHDNGIKSIFVGYDLCPDVTMAEILEQIERAVKRCLEYAKCRKSKGLIFCGHSAGGHLVASLFIHLMPSLPIDEQALIKAVIPIAGLFDLCPIRNTLINEFLRLDEAVAEAVSPQRATLPKVDSCMFYVVVGEHDSPEFKRQGNEFVEKIKQLEMRCQFSIVDDVDHFSIIERLSQRDFQLTKRIIDIFNSFR